jgi:hypothetical protein
VELERRPDDVVATSRLIDLNLPINVKVGGTVRDFA